MSVSQNVSAIGETKRVSLSSTGQQGNDWSAASAISADGRYITFESSSDNLVPGDTNGYPDIFVRDRVLGKTTRVNVSSTGEQANYYSSFPAISADGRYVVFLSEASNLVTGDTNYHTQDVFVHDLASHQTTCVSIDPTGKTGNHMSGGYLHAPAISANGRHVAFASYATNLIPNFTTNGATHIFVRDRFTGKTSLVSVDSAGNQANVNSSSEHPSISAEGRYVVFKSSANNLVTNDGNSSADIFVHDRASRKTSRVSVDSNGQQANANSHDPVISANGRYVTFESEAFNLVSGDFNGWNDVFVHDRITYQTTRVSVDSQGQEKVGDSGDPAISADGRYVAFESEAHLVPEKTNGFIKDVFVHDRLTRKITRVSVDSNGYQGSKDSYNPTISADGRNVAFNSYSFTFVPNDTNQVVDVFLRDRTLNRTVSADLSLSQTASPNQIPMGSSVTYTVTALNKGPGTIYDATIVDRMPWISSVVSVIPSQGQCNGSILVLCRLGTLAPGASATVKLTVVPVTAASSWWAQNYAVANASPLDNQQANNTSVASTYVIK